MAAVTSSNYRRVHYCYEEDCTDSYRKRRRHGRWSANPWATARFHRFGGRKEVAKVIAFGALSPCLNRNCTYKQGVGAGPRDVEQGRGHVQVFPLSREGFKESIFGLAIGFESAATKKYG